MAVCIEIRRCIWTTEPNGVSCAAMYYDIFKEFRRTLSQMATWFDKSDELAKQKSFDPNLVATFRLAPDQFALARQLQTACDTAKLGASRMTGKEAPKHDDSEKTIDELRARIASTIAFLDSCTEKDFDGAEKRVITQPRWEGKTMTGANYMMEHVMPNFFFHATHVYAILRHNGVNVGKKDYLGALTQDAPKA